MPNPIDTIPAPAVHPWHLAVLAPPGFAPDPAQLGAAVRRLTRAVRQGRRPVAISCVWDQPVREPLAELARAMGPGLSMIGAYGRFSPSSREVRRTAAELAAIADGVLVVHPGDLPRDLAWVVDVLCPWLGTPARAVRVPGGG